MPQFKVGDLVRCVDRSNSKHLVVGTIYKVSQIYNKDCLRVEGIPDGIYFYYRFVLVAELQPPKQEKIEMKIGDIALFLNDNEGGEAGAVPQIVVGKLHRCVGIPDDLRRDYQFKNDGEPRWWMDANNVLPILRFNEAADRYYYYHNGKPAPWKTRPEEVLDVARELAKLPKVDEPKKEPVKKVVEPPYDLAANKEKVRAELHEKVKNGGNGVASYAIIKSKHVVDWHIRDVCHARLRGGGQAAFDAYNGHYSLYSAEEKEAFHTFYTWMANESPWKDAFITKDVHEAINKCIEYNVDVHDEILYSAAIALRGFNEFDQQRKGWVEFHEKMEGKHAWVAALLFSSDGAKYIFSGTTNAHRTWGSFEPHESIKEFLNRGFAERPNRPWKTGRAYLKCEDAMRYGYRGAGKTTNDLVENHHLIKKEKKGFGEYHYISSFKDLHTLIKELF